MTPTMNLLRTAALLACAALAACYNYTEILQLNATCSPKDTCALPRDLDNPLIHNCDCSSLCALHDTCCIDSPFRSHFAPRRASCRPAGGESYFMLDACPRAYRGPLHVRRRCEQTPKDWSDPFVNVPVTHPPSQRTYKNVFCAVCNGEAVSDLVMWQVSLDCSSLGEDMMLCVEDRESVLRDMVYVREKAQWGLWYNDPESGWAVRYLPIAVKVPDAIAQSVWECRPNLVSDCPPEWTEDERTRRLCRSYMGVVYYEGAAYRNAHCALCNGEAPENRTCHEIEGLIYKSPAMNFGILMDIDLTDGARVGSVQHTCGAQQVFDPFAKRCRTIECPLPGSVFRNGKCTQEAAATATSGTNSK